MDTPMKISQTLSYCSMVKDYRLHDDEQELASIERFFRSGWFGVLTRIDPEMLISKLRKEKVRYDY